jgi:hypothetical protein
MGSGENRTRAESAFSSADLTRPADKRSATGSWTPWISRLYVPRSAPERRSSAALCESWIPALGHILDALQRSLDSMARKPSGSDSAASNQAGADRSANSTELLSAERAYASRMRPSSRRGGPLHSRAISEMTLGVNEDCPGER